MMGIYIGCDIFSCGVCMIFINGCLVKFCIVLVVQVDGKEIVMVEGFVIQEGFYFIQEGFYFNYVLYCGFCMLGMMMWVVELLEKNFNFIEEEICWGIVGNFCCCIGYNNIVKVI